MRDLIDVELPWVLEDEDVGPDPEIVSDGLVSLGGCMYGLTGALAR